MTPEAPENAPGATLTVTPAANDLGAAEGAGGQWRTPKQRSKRAGDRKSLHDLLEMLDRVMSSLGYWL